MTGTSTGRHDYKTTVVVLLSHQLADQFCNAIGVLQQCAPPASFSNIQTAINKEQPANPTEGTLPGGGAAPAPTPAPVPAPAPGGESGSETTPPSSCVFGDITSGQSVHIDLDDGDGSATSATVHWAGLVG